MAKTLALATTHRFTPSTQLGAAPISSASFLNPPAIAHHNPSIPSKNTIIPLKSASYKHGIAIANTK